MTRKTIAAIALLACTAVAQAGAPNFQLADLDGRKVALAASLQQGPVLLNFWATWCKPCMEELKSIQHFYQTYSDSGMAVLTVCEDEPKTTAQVKSTVRGKRYTFPVLLDPDGEVMRAYGLSEVPGLFLIDTARTIVYRHSGYKPGDENAVEREILKCLGRALPDSAAPPPAGTDTTGGAR